MAFLIITLESDGDATAFAHIARRMGAEVDLRFGSCTISDIDPNLVKLESIQKLTKSTEGQLERLPTKPKRRSAKSYLLERFLKKNQ